MVEVFPFGKNASTSVTRRGPPAGAILGAMRKKGKHNGWKNYESSTGARKSAPSRRGDTLLGNVLAEEWNDILNQCNTSLLGTSHRLALGDRRHEAHQGAVASIQPDGIGHQIELCPILAGHRSPVLLIPIEDQLAVKSFGNYVPVHPDFARAGNGQPDVAEFNGHPSGTRQAILWRMHGAARSLGGKISHKKINRKFIGTAAKTALDEFSVPEYVQRPLRNGNIHPLPIAHLQRKGSGRLSRRQRLSVASGAQEDGGPGDQGNSE